MAKKKSSDTFNYFVYLVVRVAVCIAQMLSWRAACAVGAFAGWAVYQLDKRHRQVAMDNLRRAFPSLSERLLDKTVRQVFCHFCTLVIEIILLPRKLRITNYQKYIAFENDGDLVNGLLSDRPLLILTGHFGNWELAGYALGLTGFKTYAVARALDNPYLENYLKRFRENTGQEILAKKGDFDRMTSILAKGGVIATLGDQDAGKRGLFVDFFGRPASTHKAIALMAVQFQVPIIVVGTYKISEPMKYRIAVEKTIFPEDYEDTPNPVQAITEEYTRAFERLVLRAPEQYFWLHNRWKHQPLKAAKQKKIAA